MLHLFFIRSVGGSDNCDPPPVDVSSKERTARLAQFAATELAFRIDAARRSHSSTEDRGGAGDMSDGVVTRCGRPRIDAAIAEVRGHVIMGTPKTHAVRTVALPGLLAPVLGEYLGTVNRSGLVFPDRDGGPLRVTNWNRRIFGPTANDAGLMPPNLRVHDLRHTAASLMIASGAGVRVVQHQLGHRTATMTLDRYAHLFPDDLDALSSALDEFKARSLADSLRTPGVAGDADAYLA
jgi:hypothetical protein